MSDFSILETNKDLEVYASTHKRIKNNMFVNHLDLVQGYLYRNRLSFMRMTDLRMLISIYDLHTIRYEYYV